MTDLPQNYKDSIIKISNEEEMSFFEGKLKEIEQYFEDAKKVGWPRIKTDYDLQVECQKLPFIQRCIAYKKGEFVL